MEKGSFMMGRRLKTGLLMLVCTLLLSFGVFGSDVFAEDTVDLAIEGGVEGTDWVIVPAKGNDPAHIMVLKGGSYTVRMKPGKDTAVCGIDLAGEISEDVSISLDNVHVKGKELLHGSTEANIKLNLIGTNTVRRKACDPAIYFAQAKSVSITSEKGGSLDIIGEEYTSDNRDNSVAVYNDNSLSIGGNAKITVTGFMAGFYVQYGTIEFNGGCLEVSDAQYAIHCPKGISIDKNLNHINYAGNSPTDKQTLTDEELDTKVKKQEKWSYAAIASIYNISYELGGGSLPPGYPTTFNEAEETKLPQPIKDGWVFEGWTWEGQTIPQKEVTIPKDIKDIKGGLTFTANWKELPPTVVKAPEAREDLYYTEREQALITAGEGKNGTMEYAVSNQKTAPVEGWSTDIPKGKKDGTYTVWYRVKGDGGATEPQSIKVTIEALKITLKKKTAEYTGKSPKIELKSVKYGKKSLSTNLKDYKISYSPKAFKNAGNYTVTLTALKGTYKGKKGIASFRIKQLANPLTVKRLKHTLDITASEIASKKKTIKIKEIAKITKQQGKLSYSALPGSSKKIPVNPANGSITVPKGLSKGKYRVRIEISAAGGTNYKKGSKSITLTIQVKK